ncbi:MAG: lipid A deacylase LpxR family protein [Bacteroidia bacterium]|nr:lipid A deacylase LpxR family protein [Bacteroidia bacterium]NNJ81077.1 lipid A deacylase LpxR family protein [Flavobacteriaceae bacterium]
MILFISGTLQDLEAQEIESQNMKHQVGLQHDNDFFLLTDRYYSFGLFLNYTYRPEKGIFKKSNEQLNFTLGAEAFTPDDTKTEEITEMDRPYAGYLGLNSGWTLVNNNNFYNLQLELGIAGKSSGAGAFQRWYHNAVVVSEPQSWIGELSDSFHMNLYADYAKEWQLVPNPFGVHLALRSQFAYGTKDQFIQPEIVAYFGRRNKMGSSIGYGQIGDTERELFFAFRAGYRFVAYNGLLEGNYWGDDSVFLVDPLETVIQIGFDFQHRFKKNDYKFGYRFHSDETEASQTHQYVILSYARSF